VSLSQATKVSIGGWLPHHRRLRRQSDCEGSGGSENGSEISVTTPGGIANSPDAFSVVPSIASFTPTSGKVGTSVTITGNSFTGATKVTFGGVAATSYQVISDTKLGALVPAGAVTAMLQSPRQAAPGPVQAISQSQTSCLPKGLGAHEQVHRAEVLTPSTLQATIVRTKLNSALHPKEDNFHTDAGIPCFRATARARAVIYSISIDNIVYCPRGKITWSLSSKKLASLVDRSGRSKPPDWATVLHNQ